MKISVIVPTLNEARNIGFLRRLRRTGRVVLVPRPVTTSTRRFVEQGVIRQQLLNVALLAAFLLGARPERLARWYGSSTRS